MSFRIGTGFDAHRLVADRPLLLGGVRVPCERGLLGHSDGDCLLHAICDALLGAAGAGDLGRLFPSSDARYKDAPSRLFLTEVARLIAGRFRVANVDATLIAQEPRLGPHTESMRIEIARMLGVAVERVSVKAKSSDGLGAFGRGEGIAAQAVALLEVVDTR